MDMIGSSRQNKSINKATATMYPDSGELRTSAPRLPGLLTGPLQELVRLAAICLSFFDVAIFFSVQLSPLV